MKKEQLIGRRCKGFKFLGNNEISYVKVMDECLDKIGIIRDDKKHYYPASAIEKHLMIDELPKQGWAVKNTGEDPEKWKVFVEWGIKFYDKKFLDDFDEIFNTDFYGESGGNFKNDEYLCDFDTEDGKAIELTLTQIYDYIMEQKAKEVEELVIEVGECYTIDQNGLIWVIIPINLDSIILPSAKHEPRCDANFITIPPVGFIDPQLCLNVSICYSYGDRILTKTPERKPWLEHCIKTGKYISEEEFAKLSVKNMVLVSDFENFPKTDTYKREFLHDLGDEITHRILVRNILNFNNFSCFKYMKPIPKLKEITPEELAGMGYKLKGV